MMADVVTGDDAAGQVAADAGQGGRARVRALLIGPLADAGLVRPRGVTLAEHEAALTRLADRLAYMAPESLHSLREVLVALGEGPLRNIWPSFATVWGHATRIEMPPDDERHIMVSWLRSREGPVARAGGYLVELHGWLRRHPYPPNSFVMGQIRAEAADNHRTRDRLVQRVAEGLATGSERDWLDQYLRRTAYCEALVAAGERARADAAANRGDAA